jgi:hypothetical protein
MAWKDRKRFGVEMGEDRERKTRGFPFLLTNHARTPSGLPSNQDVTLGTLYGRLNRGHF